MECVNKDVIIIIYHRVRTSYEILCVFTLCVQAPSPNFIFLELLLPVGLTQFKGELCLGDLKGFELKSFPMTLPIDYQWNLIHVHENRILL